MNAVFWILAVYGFLLVLSMPCYLRYRRISLRPVKKEHPMLKHFEVFADAFAAPSIHDDERKEVA